MKMNSKIKEEIFEYLEETDQLKSSNLTDRSLEGIAGTYRFALYRANKALEKLVLQLVTEVIKSLIEREK